MEKEIDRIEKEGLLVINDFCTRTRFTWWLKHTYTLKKTEADLAKLDGRDVATGFLEMQS